MDENKLIRQAELGRQAKQLKDNELLTAIFEGLRAQYMREWAGTTADDKQTREDKWFALHALLDVRAQMNAILSDGNMAVKSLEEYRRKQAA